VSSLKGFKKVSGILKKTGFFNAKALKLSEKYASSSRASIKMFLFFIFETVVANILDW
jgi:hypothetical protein